MECPFCGITMYDGYIKTIPDRIHKGLIWWQDERDSHKTHLFSQPGKELKVDHYEDIGYPCIKAHACPRCKKIILDSYIEQ